MSMDAVVQWILFGALGLVAVTMAAGMLLTMSMYRAGLALMASFLALAGLFLLLDADLPFAIQIMMNVGGMLVMILFMVMLMMDPGGQDMWAMKRDMRIPGPGAFSMHVPFGKPPPVTAPAAQEHVQQAHAAHGAYGEHVTHSAHAMHTAHAGYLTPAPSPALEVAAAAAQTTSHNHGSDSDGQYEMGDGMHEMHDEAGSVHEMGGMSEAGNAHDMGSMQGMSGMGGMGGMSPREHYQMLVDMAMSTRQLPIAVLLGGLAAALLATLVILTPWPVTGAAPTQDASFQVGYLLLSRYMVGFEGAAFLIVGGIAGAVVLGRREGRPGAAASIGSAVEPPHHMANMPPATPPASPTTAGEGRGESTAPGHTHGHTHHAGGDSVEGGDE